ncbi:MAG TPA: TonB-dependent receptor [Novosphingobium sp.]|nr:TonB-dependent receptor [Novosphingobium sp.]
MIAIIVGGLGGAPALAQRTAENAVTGADDAFGTQVGNENTGIYSSTDVRGFSSIKAGNARIEGVYFDQLAQLNNSARAGAVMRVGVAAVDYPFPAPTGITNYTLRIPGDRASGSASAYLNAYGGVHVEGERKFPIIKDKLSIGLGTSLDRTQQPDGSDYKARSVGGVSRFRHGTGDIVAMLSYYRFFDEKTRPLVVGRGAFVPRLPPYRRYLGQSWEATGNDNTNVGFVVRQKVTDSISLRAGAWHSRVARDNKFSDITLVERIDGGGRHFVIADPRQDARSNSGEVQLSWRGGGGRISHRVILMARGRDRRTESGGGRTFDLGPVILGQLDPEPEPSLTFGEIDVGRVRQWTGGIGYNARVGKLLELNLGLQKTDYRASFAHDGGTTRASDSPWLYNAALVVHANSWLTLYATYVTGLEESGAAPESAANRDELLPAARTRQIDGGARLDLGRIKIVASLFDIEKPYFSFDENNRFMAVGDVTHRGFEVSLSGRIGTRLNLLAGAVLMDPKVSGRARDLGLAGARPVGPTATQLRLDADYRTALPGFSVTVSASYYGKRAATAQGFAELGGRQAFIDPFTNVDLGARYQFAAGKIPMSLRFQAFNVFDEKEWNVLAPATYQLKEGRRYKLQITADF